MASNRHLGRIVALQCVYEHEFRSEVDDTPGDVAEMITRNLSQYSKSIDDNQFITQVVEGVLEKQAELDAILTPLAPDWPLAQIARIDRAILRIGLWEMLFEESVPHKVVINEAVELAKEFGSDNSSKFVNGVLGTAYREHVENAKPIKPTKKPTKSKPDQKGKK